VAIISKEVEDEVLRVVGTLQKADVKPTLDKIYGLGRIYGWDLDKTSLERVLGKLTDEGFLKGSTTTEEEE